MEGSSGLKPSGWHKFLMIVVFKTQGKCWSKLASFPKCSCVLPCVSTRSLSAGVLSHFKFTFEVTLKSSSWRPGFNRWILVLTVCLQEPAFAPQTHFLSHHHCLNRNSALFSLFHQKYPPDLKLQEASKEFMTKARVFFNYSVLVSLWFFSIQIESQLTLSVTNHSFAASFQSKLI